MKNQNGKRSQHNVNEVNADAHNVGPGRLLADLENSPRIKKGGK